MNYHNDLKTTRMTAVRDAIDAGAGPGTLEICSSAYADILLIFTFSDSCGSVAGDPARLTLAGTPKNTVGLVAGTAAIARLKDSGGKIWASGLSVGLPLSLMNVEISSMSVAVDQAVNLLSGAIVHG